MVAGDEFCFFKKYLFQYEPDIWCSESLVSEECDFPMREDRG